MSRFISSLLDTEGTAPISHRQGRLRLWTDVLMAPGKQVPRGLLPAPVFGNLASRLSSEDLALHDLPLLGKGKESGGCYKLFMRSRLPFTPIPIGLDSYTMKAPRNKETSISRHYDRMITFWRDLVHNQKEAI